jgi:potassium-transporting ATPase KdpC subunit
MRSMIAALKMTIVLTLLTGVLYPVAMVIVAHVLFPTQAAGSLVRRDGKVVGSTLIGQNFSSPSYFHGRPSAAGDKGYDPMSSGGSNLAPSNKTLIETVRSRLKQVQQRNPGVAPDQVPIDMVTASGSGLDPEISPADAELQIPRVARARGLGDQQVQKLVSAYTRARWAGILGEPGVNVLLLNLALDRVQAQHEPKPGPQARR